MRIIFSIFFVLLAGCSKTVIKPGIEIGSKYSIDATDLDVPFCDSIIMQNLYILEDTKQYHRLDHFVSDSIRVNDIINCALETPYIEKYEVQKALLNYCEKFIAYTVSNKKQPTIYNKVSGVGRILTTITTKECFEVHLKIFKFNECAGHESGTEKSTGVAYFEHMILPLISTINGIPSNDFYKDYKFEYYFADFRDDCELHFYNDLYSFIKKAWEEGKIELRAPDHK